MFPLPSMIREPIFLAELRVARFPWRQGTGELQPHPPRAVEELTPSLVDPAEVSEGLYLCSPGQLSRTPETESFMTSSPSEPFSQEDWQEKLHFIREALEVLLMRESTKSYLIDTGKYLLQKLIMLDGQKPFHFTMIYDALVTSLNQPSFWEKVTKELHTVGLSPMRPRGLSPMRVISESTLCRLTGALSGQSQSAFSSFKTSNFNEAYDGLIAFIQQPLNRDVLAQELRGAGVVYTSLYDVLLGFIAPSFFKDAENIPGSLRSVLTNDQIARPLKKVTVLVHCWAQLREKRAALREPNGFLYHLYEVMDCISPELMWAAVGPESQQKKFYYSLKEQVVSFSKALLTLAEACYPMTKLLAQHVLEDLMERLEVLLARF
ncbi:mitoguardin 1-like isoform X2 [Macrotis lagotis]|uniref:mitoguardin 1-like isoform X2 n=1 Tax=Macrotis lagotis TaxID=92651 RepID=UPI003D6987CB